MTAVVHRSLSAPSTRIVEPAGEAHFNRVVALINGFSDTESDDAAASSPTKSAAAANGGGKIPLITIDNLDEFNYYQRLGLDPLGVSVGPEQVRVVVDARVLCFVVRWTVA
jgi:hypothetical protein